MGMQCSEESRDRKGALDSGVTLCGLPDHLCLVRLPEAR